MRIIGPFRIPALSFVRQCEREHLSWGVYENEMFNVCKCWHCDS